jgi:hypothetical protein
LDNLKFYFADEKGAVSFEILKPPLIFLAIYIFKISVVDKLYPKDFMLLLLNYFSELSSENDLSFFP